MQTYKKTRFGGFFIAVTIAAKQRAVNHRRR